MNKSGKGAPIHCWLVEPLPGEVARSIERLARADDVRHVAVMPDVHLAYDVCIGVALATSHLIYPAAVGSDIGCGMAAIQFGADADLLAERDAALTLLEGLSRRVPAIKHSSNPGPPCLPTVLLDQPLSDPGLEKLKERDGRWQFGTLGRGNHFLEFQADKEGRLWLMVHSGSRGMGQRISEYHHMAAHRAGCSRGLVALNAESPPGRDYLVDARWAQEYARLNRLAMIAAVSRLTAELFGVGVLAETLIHADHNHVRRESHFGAEYWVHRKGALSAAEGEDGVIPGSMGTPSYHVTGRGYVLALASSSHGAGRALTRGEARSAICATQLEKEMRGVWFDRLLAGRLRDEAPSAYKDIHKVMRAQRKLTRIERTMRPVLSYKGV